MTLKTSFSVGLADPALVVRADRVRRTADVRLGGNERRKPDFGQNFLYPGGYPQSGRGTSGVRPRRRRRSARAPTGRIPTVRSRLPRESARIGFGGRLGQRDRLAAAARDRVRRRNGRSARPDPHGSDRPEPPADALTTEGRSSTPGKASGRREAAAGLRFSPYAMDALHDVHYVR